MHFKKIRIIGLNHFSDLLFLQSLRIGSGNIDKKKIIASAVKISGSSELVQLLSNLFSCISITFDTKSYNVRFDTKLNVIKNNAEKSLSW